MMSYNVLSDKYATRQLYGYCPSWSLIWSFRRDLIFKELSQTNADIISLQVTQAFTVKLCVCACVCAPLVGSGFVFFLLEVYIPISHGLLLAIRLYQIHSDLATHTSSKYYLHWGAGVTVGGSQDGYPDGVNPFSAPFLTHLLRCGEPISGIISKSTHSLGISGGVGRWVVQ